MLKRQLYLYLIGMGEPHQIDFRLDGVLLKRFTVGGEGKGMTAPESFAGNTQGDPEWEIYMHTADAGLEVRVPVKAGTREVGVSFVSEHWEPEGVLQPPQRGFARTTNELYHGNPAVDTVLDRRAVPGRPARATRRAGGRSSCAGRRPARPRSACAKILSTLARRAYRRPVTDAEVADAARVLQGGPSRGRLRRGHPARARADPGGAELLFRVEREPPQLAAGHAVPARPTSIWRRGCRSSSGAASRTTSCWTLAVRGKLEDPAVLEQQVRRMLRDRAVAGAGRQLRQPVARARASSPGVVPDVDEFPEFDENLREAMQQETRLFVASQLREDRSVWTC